MQKNFLKLNYLYHLEMFGENFFEGFPSSETSKKQGVLGFFSKNAKIGFITQTPLLDESFEFLPKKSAIMLEDIITKVFHFSKQDCCILSLFKTQQISYGEDLKGHINVLFSQITQSPASVFVIFGAQEVGNHLFFKNLEIGSIINFKNKNFIITHSLGALIKLVTLKKQTLEHLKTAKGLI